MLTFGVLFLGIAYLGSQLGIVPDPTEEQTVLSLLVRQIAGSGWILILAQVATALLLVLAANTSFADFPRLSSFLARDGFLPRQFAFRGERLAFTTAWENPDGSPKHETVVTLTFAEQDGKTKLTLKQTLFESVTSRDLHRGGWSSTLDLLDDYLATL